MPSSKILFLVTALLILNACSIAVVRKYDPHFKNTQEIGKINRSFQDITVTSSNKDIASILTDKQLSCRMNPYDFPTGETVGSYIKNALKDELDAAKKLSAKGQVIQIDVKQFDSNSMGFDKGNWMLDFDYHVGSTVLNVKTDTVFESSFVAFTACQNTANAIEYALRENFLAFFKKLQATK